MVICLVCVCLPSPSVSDSTSNIIAINTAKAITNLKEIYRYFCENFCGDKFMTLVIILWSFPVFFFL